MSSRCNSLLAMIACVAAPLAIFVGIAAIVAPGTAPNPQPDSGDIKHKIDVLVSHVNFINGWSLGAMGALSALGIKLMDMGRWNVAVRTSTFLGFGMLAASLYAGHESRLAILNAYLGAGFADYKSAFVTTMTWLQMIGLLVGCGTFPVVLGLQVIQPANEIEETESP